MKKITLIILLIALTVFPLIVKNDYYRHLMILVFIWVVIGTAWNLIAGFTGQVSFGDAAFFGTGAYTAGLIVMHIGWSPWWGLVLGGITATFIALPFGWISFRLRGAYFALATLALNEIMRHTATIWEDFTNGMVGILIIQTFLSKLPYYYAALFLAVSSVIIVRLVMRSKLGYYFIAIREDQDAAESLGVNTHLYKMISLAIGAALTGVAGAFYMNYMGFIDPQVVFSLYDISIMAILVGIVGGVGTIYGPAIGAFAMVGVQEFFRTSGFGLLPYLASKSGSEFIVKLSDVISRAHVLGFGILVIFVILFMPNGIAGDWNRIIKTFNFGRAES